MSHLKFITEYNSYLIFLIIFVLFAILLVADKFFAQKNEFSKRIKFVTIESFRNEYRSSILKFEDRNPTNRRNQYTKFLKYLSDWLYLDSWLKNEKNKQRLSLAGYRNPQAEISFIVFQLLAMTVLGGSALFLLFYGHVMVETAWSLKAAISVAALYIGLKLPDILLTGQISRRQAALERSLPDCLDLLVVCVEAGSGFDAAAYRVSVDFREQAPEISNEFGLLVAELAVLPERRQAYDNLAARTGLSSFRSMATICLQSERYGTSIGQALRALSKESREHRLIMAEKKAASLGPRLTIPMILFFLPVIFIVVLTPVLIRALKLS